MPRARACSSCSKTCPSPILPTAKDMAETARPDRPGGRCELRCLQQRLHQGRPGRGDPHAGALLSRTCTSRIRAMTSSSTNGSAPASWSRGRRRRRWRTSATRARRCSRSSPTRWPRAPTRTATSWRATTSSPQNGWKALRLGEPRLDRQDGRRSFPPRRRRPGNARRSPRPRAWRGGRAPSPAPARPAPPRAKVRPPRGAPRSGPAGPRSRSAPGARALTRMPRGPRSSAAARIDPDDRVLRRRVEHLSGMRPVAVDRRHDDSRPVPGGCQRAGEGAERGGHAPDVDRHHPLPFVGVELGHAAPGRHEARHWPPPCRPCPSACASVAKARLRVAAPSGPAPRPATRRAARRAPRAGRPRRSRAPARASRSAMARPSPRRAPVTTAMRPARSCVSAMLRALLPRISSRLPMFALLCVM